MDIKGLVILESWTINSGYSLQTRTSTLLARLNSGTIGSLFMKQLVTGGKTNRSQYIFVKEFTDDLYCCIRLKQGPELLLTILHLWWKNTKYSGHKLWQKAEYWDHKPLLPCHETWTRNEKQVTANYLKCTKWKSTFL